MIGAETVIYTARFESGGIVLQPGAFVTHGGEPRHTHLNQREEGAGLTLLTFALVIFL